MPPHQPANWETSFGGELRWFRTARGMKQPAFAKLLEISERKLRDLELGEPPTVALLTRIIHSLKTAGYTVEAEELLAGAGNLARKPRLLENLDFESLAKILREADERVIKSIRAHDREFISERELAEDHIDLLEASLRKGGVELREFLVKVQNPLFLEKLAQTVRPQLTVQVGGIKEGRFEKITFGQLEKVLLELKDAPLLWDCWCRAKIKNANQSCHIHSSPNGKLLENHFFNSLVEIQWRGFRFLWRNGREAWPPSIDAFILIDTLEKEGVFRQAGKTLLDIGSGTGFLGIIAAHLNDNITRVTFWDWLLTPMLYGQINWHRNRTNAQLKTERNYVSAQAAVGLFCQQMCRQPALALPYDFVLCNPPYLPIPETFRKLTFESTTSGTQLLEHVITNSPQLGKSVFIQFSLLAAIEAKAAASAGRVRLLPLSQIFEIPCRIRDAINNAEYLQYLQGRERGLRIRAGIYTHRLRAYKIVPRKKTSWAVRSQ